MPPHQSQISAPPVPHLRNAVTFDLDFLHKHCIPRSRGNVLSIRILHESRGLPSRPCSLQQPKNRTFVTFSRLDSKQCQYRWQPRASKTDPIDLRMVPPSSLSEALAWSHFITWRVTLARLLLTAASYNRPAGFFVSEFKIQSKLIMVRFVWLQIPALDCVWRCKDFKNLDQCSCLRQSSQIQVMPRMHLSPYTTHWVISSTHRVSSLNDTPLFPLMEKLL